MNPKKLSKAQDGMLGNVVKVYEVLEYIVLAELMTVRIDYSQNLEQKIIKILGNVGINKGFLSQRINSLIISGKIEKVGIDPEHRSRQFLRITEDGIVYLKKIMAELPAKVQLAKRTYTAFEAYMDQYGKMTLK